MKYEIKYVDWCEEFRLVTTNDELERSGNDPGISYFFGEFDLPFNVFSIVLIIMTHDNQIMKEYVNWSRI